MGNDLFDRYYYYHIQRLPSKIHDIINEKTRNKSMDFIQNQYLIFRLQVLLLNCLNSVIDACLYHCVDITSIYHRLQDNNDHFLQLASNDRSLQLSNNDHFLQLVNNDHSLQLASNDQSLQRVSIDRSYRSWLPVKSGHYCLLVMTSDKWLLVSCNCRFTLQMVVGIIELQFHICISLRKRCAQIVPYSLDHIFLHFS
jgi:hypothetical protein